MKAEPKADNIYPPVGGSAGADLIRDELRCGRSGCECQQANGNVHCPAHEDRTPSLSVREKDGKVLVKCFGYCTQDAVIGALRARGLWPTSSPSDGVITTRYEIKDANGELHATHVRKDLPDGSKRMWWDPKGTKPSGLPVFGSDTLNGQHLLVLVEGEKTAVKLRQQLAAEGREGIAVVASVTGASGTPSHDSLRALLQYPVVLWSDGDLVGMAHMSRVGAGLLELGHTDVKIIQGLDAADFGHPVREIIERKAKRFDPAKFPIPGPHSNQESGKGENTASRLIRVWEELEPPVRLWDVPGLLPRDTLTLWFGDSGVYKSILATTLAMSKTAGGTFLAHKLEAGPVLYVDTEFSQEEFMRRCYQLARGMGMERPPEGLHYYRTDKSLSKLIELIGNMVREVGAQLLIVDSLTLGLWDTDTKEAPEVATVLEVLTAIGCTVLVIDHTPKPTPGSNMSDLRAYGTFAKNAKARHVVQVLRAEGGAVMLRPTKSNVGKLEPGVGAEVDFIGGTAIHVRPVQMGSDSLMGIENHVPKAEQVFLTLDKHGDGATAEVLAEELEMAPRTVSNHLTTLKKQGRVESTSGRWSVIPDSRLYRGRESGISDERDRHPLPPPSPVSDPTSLLAVELEDDPDPWDSQSGSGLDESEQEPHEDTSAPAGDLQPSCNSDLGCLQQAYCAKQGRCRWAVPEVGRAPEVPPGPEGFECTASFLGYRCVNPARCEQAGRCSP